MSRKDLLFYLLIFIVIAFCIFIVYYLTTEGATCLNNPLEYYVSKTGDECWCSKPLFPR